MSLVAETGEAVAWTGDTLEAMIRAALVAEAGDALLAETGEGRAADIGEALVAKSE